MDACGACELSQTVGSGLEPWLTTSRCRRPQSTVHTVELHGYLKLAREKRSLRIRRIPNIHWAQPHWDNNWNTAHGVG